MTNESGWFVDDEQVVVFMDDGKEFFQIVLGKLQEPTKETKEFIFIQHPLR